MSDTIIQGAEKTNEQVNDNQPTDTKVEGGENKEFINSLVDEKLDTIKKFYSAELDKQKKEVSGLNRKNSELQNEIKKFRAKEMTAEEQQQLKEKELKEEFSKLYRLKAINKFEFKLDEDDDIDFADYFNGENEDEVLGKAEKLKIWIDKRISKGIEKGVEERISKGYVPKTGLSSQVKKDLATTSKEELTELYIKAQKSNNQEEKNLIKEEQMRRLKIAM